MIMAATPALSQEAEPVLASRQDWLAAHNAARTEVGLGPLQWSEALAQDAQSWANHLARQQSFTHAPPGFRKGQGENLWRGTRGFFSPRQMIASLLTEKHNFRPGTFPSVSRTGRWSDVGHYTQIIWPETRKVGCALAADRDDEVLVCRYWPAGNVVGYRLQFAQRLSQR
jgi:hypothetical protein